MVVETKHFDSAQDHSQHREKMRSFPSTSCIQFEVIQCDLHAYVST
jgi:hypothetical protein